MQIASNRMEAKIKMISSMTIFGTIGVFVHHIPMPSSMIALVRGIVGACFLLLAALLKKNKISLPNIKHNFWILCLSGAFLGVNWILLFESYRYTTVATATLCYYLAPVFVILVSPFFFKERITFAKGCRVVVALIGMVLVSGVLQNGMSGNQDMLGIFLGLGAALFYASIIILNKQLQTISSYDQTIVQLIASAVVLLPYILMKENITEIAVSTQTLVLLLIVGIVHTGISYILYFGSIKELKAQTVAMFSYIDPVVAILVSIVILKEEIHVFSIIGAILILGSTFFNEV